MNKIESGKVLIGSTLKELTKAKKIGKLDLKVIYLYKVIRNLYLNCYLNESHSIDQELIKIMYDLEKKYPQICSYRERKSTDLFINGPVDPDYNTTVIPYTPPFLSPFNCINYNYEDVIFNTSYFIDNYSSTNSAKYLRIISLPSIGTLLFNNEPVIENQIILLTDVNNLVYDLGLVYSEETEVTFEIQLGDNAFNTQFSNTELIRICVPEKANSAPTVDNQTGTFVKRCKIFNSEDFVLNFTDPDEGDEPETVRILTLPSIGELTYNGNNIITPFEFNHSTVDNLEYCLPANYSYSEGSIYEYDDDLEVLLNNLLDDGYTIDSFIDGDYTLTKDVIEILPNQTNIYAIFDTTSMQYADGIAAKNALESWYNQFIIDNPSYTGNLYIIPLSNEDWLLWGAIPKFGVNIITPQGLNTLFIDTSPEWQSIQVLPPNISSNFNWVPDPNALVLAFIDEANARYHSSLVSDGFDLIQQGVPVEQPTADFKLHLATFLNIYNDYDFFRGLIYPIVRDEAGQGGALVLQVMAALEAKILSQSEIDAYNTNVNCSILLKTNPYTVRLKDYGWSGILDKTSPAVNVFDSGTFSNDLELFLNSSSNIITLTEIIDGTLVTNDPDSISFNFQTSDNDEVEPLFSNIAIYNFDFSSIINLPPSSLGNGNKTIPSNTIITFTREDFTSSLVPPYRDPEGNPAYALKILSLPTQGSLVFNNIEVEIDQEILFSEIDNDKLKYIPDPKDPDYVVSFDFTVSDTGSKQFI